MSIILQKTFSFTFLLLLLVICVIFILWKRGRTYYLAWKLPGINGYPIVGCAPYFLNSDKILENITQLCGKLNFARVWLGPIPCIGVAKPEHLQIILNSPHCLARDLLTYRKDDGLFEKGLTAVKPETWKIHRKLLNPAFSRQITNSYLDIFCEQTRSLLKCLEVHEGNGEFDIYHYLERCSLDIICETTMGSKVEALNSNPKIFHTLSRLCELVTERMVRVWLIPTMFWKLSSRGREFEQLKDEVHQYIKPIIKTRQAEHIAKIKKIKQRQTEEFNNGSTERKLFIDILFEANNDKIYDETELLQEIITFIAAGTETVALSASYCLLALAMNHKIQDKVVEELEYVIGKTDRSITVGDLSKLRYLDQTYRESLRCFPPIPLVPREIEEEITLEEHIIPKHTTAILCLMQVHNDPHIWREPHVFNPDRFKPNECLKRHPYSFLPFGGGQRNCIGKRYAYMLAKVYLANILRKYKVTTSLKQENMKHRMKVTLQLIGGFQLSLEYRYK